MPFKFIHLLLALAILFSCKKEKFSNVLILGHAGNGLNVQNAIYHDNSREAIDFALSMEGSNGVEIDVQLSADGKLWLFHNNTLEKETNFSGCISDYSSEELSNCYYSTLKKEKLVQLAEIDFEKYLDRTFVLDLRHYRCCDFQLTDTVTFIQELVQFKINNPSIHFLISTNYKNWLQSLNSLGFEVFFEVNSFDETINFDAAKNFILKNNNFSKEEVKIIQASNKKVLIFEVRSPKFIRKAMDKQPYGILSDDLRAAIIEKY